MLFFEGGEPFSNGLVQYEYQPATEWDVASRILIPIRVGGIFTRAFVDTGAPYTICTPDIAQNLDLDPDFALEAVTLRWHGLLSGRLYRQDFILVADEGESAQIEATMFVPDRDSTEAWEYGRRPFVIGMGGCLDFIRFAVNPDTEVFYFGHSIW